MAPPKIEDDERKCKIVRFCMNKRWRYEEAKSFLEKAGCQLSEKQFQRYKKRIKDIDAKKISELPESSFAQFTLDTLDELCVQKTQYEEHSKTTENFWEKKACTEMILKINSYIAKILDSSTVVDRI